jgi:hypothetical protein
VKLLAGPQPVDVPRDDGSKQKIFRCLTYQVAVFSHYGHPDVRFVRGGTLDQPSSVVPDVHIFTRSKLPWITLPNSAPAFGVYYDSKALWPAGEREGCENSVHSDQPWFAGRWKVLTPARNHVPEERLPYAVRGSCSGRWLDERVREASAGRVRSRGGCARARPSLRRGRGALGALRLDDEACP